IRVRSCEVSADMDQASAQNGRSSSSPAAGMSATVGGGTAGAPWEVTGASPWRSMRLPLRLRKYLVTPSRPVHSRPFTKQVTVTCSPTLKGSSRPQRSWVNSTGMCCGNCPPASVITTSRLRNFSEMSWVLPSTLMVPEMVTCAMGSTGIVGQQGFPSLLRPALFQQLVGVLMQGGLQCLGVVLVVDEDIAEFGEFVLVHAGLVGQLLGVAQAAQI